MCKNCFWENNCSIKNETICDKHITKEQLQAKDLYPKE